MGLEGPRTIDGQRYRLVDVTYCLTAVDAGAAVSAITVGGLSKSLGESDSTDRPDPGCYTLDAGFYDSNGYQLRMSVTGGNAMFVYIDGIRSTWEPNTRAPSP